MAERFTSFIVRKFPVDLHRRLKQFAEDEGRTMQWIVLKAVAEYLDREERKTKRGKS